MENTAIDINILKNNYDDDPLPFHMWSVALDCKRRRDAYWRHYKNMKKRANILSIPLLILTSITGLTSVANVSTNTDDSSATPITLPIITSIFGVSSAILSAMQRYFQFAERGERSKHMAKSYSRIARRIENTMVLLKSDATTMNSASFQKFVEEVQKDTEALMQETDDIPRELLNERNIYKDMLNSLKTHTKTLILNKPIGYLSQQQSTNVDDTDFQNINLPDLQSMTFAAARKAGAQKQPTTPPQTTPPAIIQEFQNMWTKVKQMTKEVEKIEQNLEQAKREGDLSKESTLTSLLDELRVKTKETYEDTIKFAKLNNINYLSN
jgi:uncharacterized protein Yka (UPF0111/DUF47 family)